VSYTPLKSFLLCVALAALPAPSVLAEDLGPTEVMHWGEGVADTLDPHTTRSTTDVTAKINLYDGLYRYQGNPPDLIPWLAESSAVSADGLTWTFTLRKDVRFHDGSPMTSDDVVFSFRRLLALKQAPSAPFWPVLKPDNVVATAPYEVKFTLDRPYAPFLAAIPMVGIVERKVAEAHVQNGDNATAWLAGNDAGTGAYTVEPDSFRPSQSVVYDWFPDYFKGWGAHPIKRVYMNTIKEETTLALALLKGEIDATDTRISADTIDRLKKGDSVTIAHDESMRTFVMTMNNSRRPLDNVHVRRAISYAFDYAGYIAKLREGTVVRNPGPIPETVWGAPKDLKGYSHDVSKAREELELAQKEGVDLSRTLTMYDTTNSRDTVLAAQLLQSALRQLGIKVEIKDAFFPALASMAANKDTAPDMWFHWVSAFFVDPSNWIGEMYDSRYQGTWKASAYYDNPEVSQILREALAISDQDKRRVLYEEASRMIVSDAPTLWIYNAVEYRGLSKRVQGYVFSPVGGGSEFHNMWLSN
jgi:peptide/nickel transport system substrate-binding protein